MKNWKVYYRMNGKVDNIWVDGSDYEEAYKNAVMRLDIKANIIRLVINK